MTVVGSYIVFAMLLVLARIVRRHAPRQLLLVAASYLFYATWGAWFLAVLVFSSLFNFGYGAFLRQKPTAGRLWGGIAGNVLLLGFFKYAPALAPFAAATSQLAALFNGIALPLGISFWTFQALSYLFDIYREEEVDPSLLEFCLYMAFWPTVVMGPVCRLPNMLPQFREVTTFSSADTLEGSRRILTGLFMKFVMAQALSSGFSTGGGVVGGFDRDVAKYSGLDVWFLAVGFGFQLFFDFAGYSHIVIGAARVFGFRLEENFASPYLATTPSEFWTRWHMSLSSWIRDYVFVPLAAIRRGVWWRYLALLLSMTLFGLWHGARSTFVLWGLYQGLLLVLHRLSQQFRRNSSFQISDVWVTPLSSALTFMAISFGWVFFRANHLDQAVAMVRSALSPIGYFHLELVPSFYLLVGVVVIGYFGFETLRRTLFRGIRLVLTPDWNRDALVRLGITPEFLSFVSFIPVVFLLFFVMLVIHSESDGITPFVYTLF